MHSVFCINRGRWTVDRGLIFLPNIRYETKIFSRIPLNSNRLFVTIVVRQNNMMQLTNITKQFTHDAIVRNVISVLLIVIILLVKPAGAIMV
jgi:hypothetical protein